MTTLTSNLSPEYPHRKGASPTTHKPKFGITVRIEPDGRIIRLEGREAWAMRQLVHAGARGCTPITHPGPRWSDYVHKLRHIHGFVIETVYEAHGGPFKGSHAVYHLHTKVTIIEDTKVAA